MMAENLHTAIDADCFAALKAAIQELDVAEVNAGAGL
jgi:hypothetical protein